MRKTRCDSKNYSEFLLNILKFYLMKTHKKNGGSPK